MLRKVQSSKSISDLNWLRPWTCDRDGNSHYVRIRWSHQCQSVTEVTVDIDHDSDCLLCQDKIKSSKSISDWRADDWTSMMMMMKVTLPRWNHQSQPVTEVMVTMNIDDNDDHSCQYQMKSYKSTSDWSDDDSVHWWWWWWSLCHCQEKIKSPPKSISDWSDCNYEHWWGWWEWWSSVTVRTR